MLLNEVYTSIYQHIPDFDPYYPLQCLQYSLRLIVSFLIRFVVVVVPFLEASIRTPTLSLGLSTIVLTLSQTKLVVASESYLRMSFLLGKTRELQNLIINLSP
jgi:hypothetical protein